MHTYVLLSIGSNIEFDLSTKIITTHAPKTSHNPDWTPLPVRLANTCLEQVKRGEDLGSDKDFSHHNICFKFHYFVIVLQPISLGTLGSKGSLVHDAG